MEPIYECFFYYLNVYPYVYEYADTEQKIKLPTCEYSRAIRENQLCCNRNITILKLSLLYTITQC